MLFKNIQLRQRQSWLSPTFTLHRRCLLTPAPHSLLRQVWPLVLLWSRVGKVKTQSVVWCYR